MNPHFLILKFAGAVPLARWTERIEKARGHVLAAAEREAVTALEAGSAHESLLIARFAFVADLDAAWAALGDLAESAPGLTALAAPGIPWEGWPGHFAPTIATVDVPDAGAPRAFMLIEGTGRDEKRMDRYRDIILPMLRERGGYYTLFDLSGSVRVLAGRWSEAVLAISRWPSRALAEDFWYAERYQREAIPVRTGVSRFDVQLVEGIAG